MGWLSDTVDHFMDEGSEIALVFGGIGGILGAIYGWQFLPAESLNIFQLATAMTGLVGGVIVGFILGLFVLPAFYIAIIAGILYFLFSV